MTQKVDKTILQENITRKSYLVYYDTKSGQENITRKGYLVYYDLKGEQENIPKKGYLVNYDKKVILLKEWTTYRDTAFLKN